MTVARSAQRGGAGKCVSCSHPQLTEIDADLVAGVPLRAMTKKYGISNPRCCGTSGHTWGGS